MPVSPRKRQEKPLITITTDFGLSDHFVGVMKGVIAGIAPSANVIDITHEIAPFNLAEAAFTLSETWPYFPKGAIHLVVVDPGVGSARRAVLVEAAGQYFIGPDNGVFSMIYDAGPHKVREITNARKMRGKISKTFHGRDVFAPAAAHLAARANPAQFGKLINDYVRLPLAKPKKVASNVWQGTVLKADRFGNLITNFAESEFKAVRTQPFEMRIEGTRLRRFVETYSEAKAGELLVIAGSAGYLEIAANQSSAAQILECRSGAQVELEINMTPAKTKGTKR